MTTSLVSGNETKDILPCVTFISVTTPGGDEEMLKRIVGIVGPVVVAVHSESFAFKNYIRGIYAKDPECQKTVDHAVLVVGYGTDNGTGQDFWIVQNSWGAWGENYTTIRMARNQNNYCNISTYMFYPFVYDNTVEANGSASTVEANVDGSHAPGEELSLANLSSTNIDLFIRQSWDNFKRKYDGNYYSAQVPQTSRIASRAETTRFVNFKANLERVIRESNSLSTSAKRNTYQVGVNGLGDMMFCEELLPPGFGIRGTSSFRNARFEGPKKSEGEIAWLCNSKVAAKSSIEKGSRAPWKLADAKFGLHYVVHSDLSYGPLPTEFSWINRHSGYDAAYAKVLSLRIHGVRRTCWLDSVVCIDGCLPYPYGMKQIAFEMALRRRLRNRDGPMRRVSPYNGEELIRCWRRSSEIKIAGWPSNMFEDLADEMALTSEDWFYRRNGTITKCLMKAETNSSHFYNNITASIATLEQREGNELLLQRLVSTVGPVVVVVHANSFAFRNYIGGVYANDADCSKPVDHSMVVVGYGNDAQTGLDYWLLQNNWGTEWGEAGFIRLARNKNNYCNISTYMTYIYVHKGLKPCRVSEPAQYNECMQIRTTDW